MKRRYFVWVGVLTFVMTAFLGLTATAEFTPVAYIETDGSQYIDTGIKPDGTTTLEMKIYAPSTSSDVYFYGVAASWISKAFACYRKANANSVGVVSGARQSSGISIGTGPTYVIRHEPGAFFCNGVQLASGLDTNFQAADNLQLFGISYAGEHMQMPPAGWRIYSAKIWQGDELILNLVPCSKDGVGGLIDILSGTFYGSSAESGGFVPGPAEDDFRFGEDGSLEYRTTISAPTNAVYSLNGTTCIGATQVWARAHTVMTLDPEVADSQKIIWRTRPADSRLDGDVLAWTLTDGVQISYLVLDADGLVDYVMTDGSQYIDTGIKPDGTTTLEMKIYAPRTSSDVYFYGVAASWISKAFACYRVKNGDSVCVVSGARQSSAISIGTGPTYVIRHEPGAFFCNGVRLTSGLDTNFQAEDNLLLFGLSYGGECLQMPPAGWRIYSAKIWQGETLVRDYIPLVQDGVAGLYDLEEGRFYAGAGAVGGFLPPVDVVIDGEDRPRVAVPLTASVPGQAGCAFRWVRVGNPDVTVAETAEYTPTDADLEHWLKVVVMINGVAVGERKFYFSRLPVVYLNTDSGLPVTDHDNYVPGMLRIQGNAEFAQQYDGPLEVKGRGNASWTNFAQKPYKLKLDKKTDLFGFGKQKHWVLISNFADNAFMRNRHGMELARVLGIAAMDMTWVAVVLNGQYYGVEMLSEHIRVDENRIDVFNWEEKGEDIADALYKAERKSVGWTDADKSALEDLMSSDFSWLATSNVTFKGVTYDLADYGLAEEWNLTGGYLFEMEDRYDAPSKFQTAQKRLHVHLSKPEFAQTCGAMCAAAQKIWNDVEAAYLAVDHCSPDGGRPLADLADLDSMVGYWLTLECLGNFDSLCAHSRYSYVDVAGKLVFGPVWDFDYGGGSIVVQNDTYGVYARPDHWSFKYWETHNPGTEHSGAGFYVEWMDDPLFVMKAYGLYWHRVRPWLVAELATNGGFDRKIAYLTEAGDAHDVLYKTKYGLWGFGGANGDAAKYRTYLTARLAWLDQQFASIDTLMASVQSASGYAPSAHPYVKSDALSLAVKGGVATNVTCNTDFAVASADGSFALSLATAEDSFVKADIYLNGVKCPSVAFLDGKGEVTFATAGMLPAATNRFLVSVIVRNASDQVVARSYATVLLLPDTSCRAFEGLWSEGAVVALTEPSAYMLDGVTFGSPLTFTGDYPLVLGIAGCTRNIAPRIATEGSLMIIGGGVLSLDGGNGLVRAAGPVVASGVTLELSAGQRTEKWNLVLDHGAQLVLKSDLVLNDLDIRDSAAVIRLNGHALTIRSSAHKDGKGWNADYTLDARGGAIVWKPKGIIVIVR